MHPISTSSYSQFTVDPTIFDQVEFGLFLIQTNSDSSECEEYLFNFYQQRYIDDILVALDLETLLYKKDFFDNSILHVAILNGHEELVLKLLDYLRELTSTDFLLSVLNCKNCAHETLLHLAVRRKQIGIIRALVENGANLNLINIYGESIYTIAEQVNLDLSSILLTEKNPINEAFINSCIKLDAISNYPLPLPCTVQVPQQAEHTTEPIQNTPDATSRSDKGTEIIPKAASQPPLEDAKPKKKFRMSLNKIIQAVHSNSLGELIRDGIDINWMTQLRTTALMHSAQKGDLVTVRALLEQKARADVIDKKGRTALHIALRKTIKYLYPLRAVKDNTLKKKYLDISLELAVYDPSVATIADEKQQTPLELSQLHSPTNVISQILKGEVRIESFETHSIKISDSQDPIVFTVKQIDSIFRQEIEKEARLKTARRGAFIAKEIKSADPILACKTGDLEGLKALITPKNARDLSNRFLLLHTATIHGHEHIVQFLLEQGVELNYKDKAPPLYLAAQKGHVKIMKLLLNHQADVNLPNYRQSTPLYIAASEGKTEAVNVLIEYHADATRANYNQMLPLHSAIRRKKANLVLRLINYDSSVINFPDKAANTPLHLAAQHDMPTVVKMLLEKGADPTLKNSKGQTPYDIVKDRPKCTFAEMLLEGSTDLKRLTG